MTLLLAGDIGGTKTILRLNKLSLETDKLQTLYEETYPSGNFPDLVPIVQEFLTVAGQQLGSTLAPEKACFAIAGPVVNNTAKLTNLPWLLERERLEIELGIAAVKLINDFEAVGYGVLGLEPSDLYTLQDMTPQPGAPIGIIGAGTGLGEGFLIELASSSYKVFPSEGGHADFAPRTELEFQLLQYLRDKYNVQRISVERVVSGQGIVAIYQFLRERHFAQELPEVGQVIRTWEQEMGKEKTVDPAATIAIAAAINGDRLSRQTMQMFVEAYGAEAGNLALKLLPYGGLYVAGGIATKNLTLLKEGSFLRALVQKGRVSPLLEKVPVHIILNPRVGLIGAAVCAARL
ncbi:MAG: glucokinase [Kastovskya adunca ATA6-11-RM4]|jgi:glucokinase|nr:glucokinase [Kastovskya adunca ATA6-11-RM4]